RRRHPDPRPGSGPPHELGAPRPRGQPASGRGPGRAHPHPSGSRIEGSRPIAPETHPARGEGRLDRGLFILALASVVGNLLVWGASPALLSYAVEGYPWGAVMLPHALVLAIVFARSFRRWWVTLPALALVWELPWHGYELGKTAGTTLVLAAALAPEAGWFR